MYWIFSAARIRRTIVNRVTNSTGPLPDQITGLSNRVTAWFAVVAAYNLYRAIPVRTGLTCKLHVNY